MLTRLATFTLALALLVAPAPQTAHAAAKSGDDGAKPQRPALRWNRARTLQAAKQIDELVAKNYAASKVTPTRITNDTEFLRRVYLDITGTIPNFEQTDAFLLSRDPAKRQKLIDYLLKSPGYASHNYNYWADILRVRNRVRGDAANDYGRWVKQSIADNMPYDEMVYALVTAEGKARHNGAAGYWLRDQGMVLDVMSNTSRIFLGTQIGCAQCHDHPFDDWTQKQFYEMAAFVGGVNTRMRQGGYGMDARQRMRNAAEYRKLIRSGELDNRTRQVLTRLVRENSYGVTDTSRQLRYPSDYKYKNAKPGSNPTKQVIFAPDELPVSAESSRHAFATWLTDQDNPRFASVIANRMWQKVTGVGLVEPVDEWYMDSAGSNPELLKYLTRVMIETDFDLKQFQRVLYYSKTYQLAVARNEVAIQDHRHESARLRRMSAEQIWDSLLTLAVPDPTSRESMLQGYGGRFTEVLDQVDKAQDVKEVLAIAEQLAKNPRQMMGNNAMAARQRYRDRGFAAYLVRASEMPQPAPAGHFLRDFGQSDREAVDSATTDPSVPQVLALLNGQITGLLLNSQSVLMQNVERAESPKEKIETIYLSMLNRKPYAGEMSLAMQEVEASGNNAYRDIVWAIANTREFIFIQ